MPLLKASNVLNTSQTLRTVKNVPSTTICCECGIARGLRVEDVGNPWMGPNLLLLGQRYCLLLPNSCAARIRGTKPDPRLVRGAVTVPSISPASKTIASFRICDVRSNGKRSPGSLASSLKPVRLSLTPAPPLTNSSGVMNYGATPNPSLPGTLHLIKEHPMEPRVLV